MKRLTWSLSRVLCWYIALIALARSEYGQMALFASIVFLLIIVEEIVKE